MGLDETRLNKMGFSNVGYDKIILDQMRLDDVRLNWIEEAALSHQWSFWKEMRED